MSLAEMTLGEALGQEYVAGHFPPDSKAAMVELVANLVEAYRRDIEKLEPFRPRIGYPDRPSSRAACQATPSTGDDGRGEYR